MELIDMALGFIGIVTKIGFQVNFKGEFMAIINLWMMSLWLPW
jgi:hypothetical protein